MAEAIKCKHCGSNLMFIGQQAGGKDILRYYKNLWKQHKWLRWLVYVFVGYLALCVVFAVGNGWIESKYTDKTERFLQAWMAKDYATTDQAFDSGADENSRGLFNKLNVTGYRHLITHPKGYEGAFMIEVDLLCESAALPR